MNCHGNNFHPDLPPCVRCGGAEFNQCVTTIGGGLSVQYACVRCGIRAVFCYAGPPGVLVWAIPEEGKDFNRDLNAYLQAVQNFQMISIDPSVPFPTTMLPVHRLEDGVWVRLEFLLDPDTDR